MSLRAHVPPVLSTVTLSCIDTPVFKCRLWMLISLPAYKHDYPNCVVWSDRNTRHSANKVHSAMMHLEKSAPGSLDERDSLGFALKWLKRIDEGNKVRVCGVCVASGVALHSPHT
jgi:hypothetical protein